MQRLVLDIRISTCLCCITATLLGYHWKFVFEFYIKWCENGYSGSLLLRCASVHYLSTKWSKYSNCTVNPLKCSKEQGIHLIHCFGQEQAPLLTHVIDCRIQVSPGYFINRVRPTWPSQNVTWLAQTTWMTQPGFNPDSL